ncbi:MAG: antibiotic biosynthesis monooxygenase [bacterium]|nr:antibiotic biosynthesis monooxygenase [bacterium]MDE0605275.1 antibiotic biosynthesis monooxygenase [bacterium]
MIVVAGSVSVPAENSEAFMSAAADVSAASRTLDGNIDYCISMQSPGVFRFLEIWETEEAMMAQFAAPPFGAFQAAVSELGMAGMDGKKYEISSVGPLFG